MQDFDYAVPIPLPVWQDPQSNPVLLKTRDGWEVILACWTDEAEPTEYVAVLSFQRAWAVRAVALEEVPLEMRGKRTRSDIYRLEGSLWLSSLEATWQALYSHWPSLEHDPDHHYWVQGHDSRVEVIASDFSVERKPNEEYANILPLR
ncbi:MAG: hypothetical protein HKN04_14455 [Rhodothermaceae bacterium]|nr:hypothetical protein [Rhodothermaceae bacterium]